MSTTTLTFLIITAFAAAVVGRLRSLPLTYLGALILALATYWVGGFLKFSGRWTNVPDVLPTIMLFIVLLLLPQAELQFARIGQIKRVRAGLDGARHGDRDGRARRGDLGADDLPLQRNPTNVNRFTLGMCTALVALSLVPLTGWAGQVSLAPLAFAGIGAVAYARLGGAARKHLGRVPRRVGDHPGRRAVRVPGHAAAGPLPRARDACVRGDGRVGVLHPALRHRLRGAFGRGRAHVRHPLRTRSDTPEAFLLLVTAVFGLCGIGVVALAAQSPSGGDSSRSATAKPRRSTVGVNVLETKLAVFMLSAGMAGFAGAFLAQYYGTMNGAQGSRCSRACRSCSRS